MKEIWKEVDGYAGFYSVSNKGNVYNNKWGRHVKQHANKGNSYMQVKLYRNQISKHFYVHRLVAIYFVENKHDKKNVNHIDCNKQNNIYTNLEWVTKSENGRHAGKNGLISVNLRKPVLMYDKDGNILNEYKSLKDAEIDTGVFKSNISSCCKGKSKTAGGYIWGYK